MPTGWYLPSMYQSSDSQKGNKGSHKVHCLYSLGSGSEEVPGVQVSRCHLGPTLQVGLSKESSFRPGMLTLLHGVCVWRSEVEGGEERDYE